MPRTTVGQTAQRIRRQLSSSVAYEINLLGATIDSATDTLTFRYTPPPSVQAGSMLDIGTERMYVLECDKVNKSAIVVRAFQDTEADIHLVGDEIQINARFPMAGIVDSMKDEVMSWPPELYQISDGTFSIASALVRTATYELPAIWSDALWVTDVRVHTDYDETYISVPSTAWPRARFRMQRGSIGGFDGAPNSGILLRLIDTMSEGSIYIQVARPFDVSDWDWETDLVTGTGLTESMLDVLTMGVKLRLMDDSENARNARDVANEPRRYEETQVGQQLSTQRSLLQRYFRRRGEEVTRLRMAYPVRSE